MKTFDAIEREAFQAVERLQTSVNIVGASNDAAVDILAQVSEDLRLSEPVSVSIVSDASGSLHHHSSAPIGAYIISIAANLTSNSVVEDHLLDFQCRSLVSFPERLANKIAESKNATFTFKSELYWERLSDAVLLFYFNKPQRPEETAGTFIAESKLGTVLGKIIAVALRRNSSGVLARRFFLLPRDLFQNSHFRTRFPLFIEAVFEACKIHRFSVKPHKPVEVSHLWQQWNVELFHSMEKRGDIKTEIVAALNEIMNNFSSDGSTSLARALFNAIFVDTFFLLNSSRGAIRTVFKDVLDIVAGNAQADDAFSSREQACFSALFELWDRKEFVTSGDLGENLNLLHPVMYALLYLKRRYPTRDAFPQKYVGGLLGGVSLRLDSTRGAELRTCAMTVAAAFATLFVSNSDSVAPLLQDENFSRALESWMKEEPSTNHNAALAHNQQPQGGADSEKSAAFARRSVAFSDVYPLDPEATYTFFVALEQRSQNQVAKREHQNGVLQSSSSATLPSALPSFGQQKYTKDELGEHVSILKSVRECYNALIGVGRGPNAQLNEVQEATESGLRGLADAFSKLKDHIDSELFKTVSRETGPLIPALLPALISLSIHAPEEEKRALLQIRYDVLVGLILLNPLQCLSQLGGMLYRSNYGIYQRNELIKATGEAAYLLSKVEVKPQAAGFQNDSNSENGGQKQKRIYPPIPTHHLAGEHRTAIVVSEGQHTRRWGNASFERMKGRRNPKHYTNFLGDVAAAFIAAFLFKLDADHFGFFQESDPYTPCAILDSLTIVFQGITNVRHVAPDLCEKNFDFFFAVCTKHPNLTVKKAAWTSVVEVMRTWCGVGPLWIRRKDGQRVLNRDAGLHRSLMFTQNWLSALDLLQHTCEKMLQSNDGCGRTALIAVSTLRDLVCDRDDFQSMLSQSEKMSFSD